MFFSWHTCGSVSTDVAITSHLQASSVLSGQQEPNTCDLEMMSLIANRSDDGAVLSGFAYSLHNPMHQ